jgi:NAD(P)-dependent dehydrogenase (short-subunit alcohol dehydrogenase family)
MAKSNWNKNNIPELNGKTIIVTGGNSGLGYESVKAFAEQGADVILASRSIEKGEKAKQEIGKVKGNIEVMQLDLGDFSSIQTFVESYKSKHTKLDILLNNAGIMWCPYSKTKNGLESQMGVNHFGHFSLTGQLLDVLKKTKNARVINVSSLGHRRGKMDFENLLFNEENYDPNQAYFNSKLANLLFTYELQRQFENQALDLISTAAHPGGSATNLSRHVEGKFWFRLLKPLLYLLAQSAAKGALPQIRASVDSNVKGGEYYGPKGFNEMGGYPVLVESIPASHNKEDARKLWEYSEELTGTRFNFKA